MNNDIKSLIDYRLAKSNEALEVARLAIQNELWRPAASNLYYTCFYTLTALVAKHNIRTHTHTGVKAVLGSEFIRKGKVEAKWGKLFANLFDGRQKGDYGDFVFLTQQDILPLLKEVEEFRQVIKKLIDE